jgi:hypothetical protein
MGNHIPPSKLQLPRRLDMTLIRKIYLFWYLFQYWIWSDICTSSTTDPSSNKFGAKSDQIRVIAVSVLGSQQSLVFKIWNHILKKSSWRLAFWKNVFRSWLRNMRLFQQQRIIPWVYLNTCRRKPFMRILRTSGLSLWRPTTSQETQCSQYCISNKLYKVDFLNVLGQSFCLFGYWNNDDEFAHFES